MVGRDKLSTKPVAVAGSKAVTTGEPESERTAMRHCPRQWLLGALFLLRIAICTSNVVQVDDEENRIVDGQDAPEGRYPYAVTLQRGFASHVCMGSLIAPDLVLTAAHCGEMREAHIGRDRVRLNNNRSETFALGERVFHPRYDFTSFDYDFSILQLEGESTIPPISLNRNPAFPGEASSVTTMGWGRTNATVLNSYADQLQEATLVVIDNEPCVSLWNSDVKDHMFCTTNEGTGAGCQGDSGAPVILKGSNAAADVQLGILSWGPTKCDDARLPSVNQRVSAELDWIESIVCELSNSPPEEFNCDGGTFTVSPAPTLSPTGPTASPAPTTTKVPVRVSIKLDRFPQEFGWKIEDEVGNKVAGENPGFYSVQEEEIEQTVFLEYDKTHSFTAIDIAGDGMCCQDGNGNYRVLLRDNNRTLVSGNGIFQGVKRHKFVVLDVNPASLQPAIFPSDTNGNYAISVRFRLDEDAGLFGWLLERLDLDERRLIVNVPPGSYESGSSVFDTVRVDEGGLYLITFYDDGFNSVSDEITVRLGSSTGKVLRISGAFSEPQQRTFVASSSGEISIPTFGDQRLSLFLRFDSFPEEVGWFLLAGSPSSNTTMTDQLTGPISTSELQEPTDELSVVAFGPTQPFDGVVANRELTATITLPRLSTESRQFVLVVHDFVGDGICCGFGNGFYNLYWGPAENEILLTSGTVEETERDVYSFTLASSGPPTPVTTPSPSSATNTSTSGGDSFFRIGVLSCIGALLGILLV